MLGKAINDTDQPTSIEKKEEQSQDSDEASKETDDPSEETDSTVMVIDKKRDFKTIFWSPTGRLLAAVEETDVKLEDGSNKAQVVLFDYDKDTYTFTERQRLPIELTLAIAVTIVFSKDGNCLAVTQARASTPRERPLIFNIADRKNTYRIFVSPDIPNANKENTSYENKIMSMSFSSDGQLFAYSVYGSSGRANRLFLHKF